jgi:hypothetical protein
MAPPRTFDYDLVKRLLREHPDWQYSQYADAATQDARKTDPRAPRVRPATIRHMVSQYRDRWADEGMILPPRGVVMADLLPPLGTVAPSQRMATPLRYLRELSKHRQGEAPVTGTEATVRRQALRWEGLMRDNKEIADLTEHGMVVVRPARADELDEKGGLIDVAAWALPGWQAPARRNSRGRG